MKFIYIPTEV